LLIYAFECSMDFDLLTGSILKRFLAFGLVRV